MIYPTDDDGIIRNVVIVHESPTYTNDPTDKGGPTKFGITIPALASYRGHPVTAADVEGLLEPEAVALYRQNYIARVGFDKITDVRVRTAVVDMAVLFGQTGAADGVEEAARALKGIHGLPDHPVITDDDAATINAVEARATINALSVHRIQHHGHVVHDEPSQAKYINGWLARACEFIQ